MTEKLYKYGVGDVKDKAKRLLIDLGVIEDSGIVHGVLKGVLYMRVLHIIIVVNNFSHVR